jgi:hypothetical protein
MNRTIGILVLMTLMLGAGCGREIPNRPDGKGTIVIAAIDTSGFFPGSALGEPYYMDSTEVSIQSQTHIFTANAMTDETGVVSFERLDTGSYSVFVRRAVDVGPNKMVFTGFGQVAIQGNDVASDTVLVKTVSVSNLMINEINFTGSCASTFYFYDQFVELYNASADTLYLDNTIITRQLQTKDPEMEIKDYVSAIYAFQLHGTGRQYPIKPKQYVVIAADAVDHRQWCSTAVDLSKADYECFNALGNDFDVPGVPNFESIMPTRSTDFLINLSHNAVVLAAGGNYVIDELNYMHIPIKDVIDGVEYNSNPAYSKEMTVRVDAGFAGIGIVKYSGYSTERREPGLDTNNSTFDFIDLVHPTPGFFHAPQGQTWWR